MKKIRRRRNKKYGFLAAIILVVAIATLSSGYALMSANIQVVGKGSITAKVDEPSNFDGGYDIKNKWSNGDITYYNGTITIVNNSGHDIVNWTIEIGTDTKADAWINANVVSEEHRLIITPYEWNNVIKAGETFTIDNIIFLGDSDFIPRYISINGESFFGQREDDTVALEYLKFDKDIYTVDQGESILIEAKKYPVNAFGRVKYTSSNESIATVDKDGNVSGLRSGEVTITATSEGVSTSCKVKVSESENLSSADLDVKFELSNYWGSSIQFKFVIKNKNNYKINKYSFKVGFPTGTKYQIWTGYSSVQDNVVITSNMIDPNGEFTIWGQVDLPSGYNAADYLNPRISNMIVLG